MKRVIAYTQTFHGSELKWVKAMIKSVLMNGAAVLIVDESPNPEDTKLFASLQQKRVTVKHINVDNRVAAINYGLQFARENMYDYALFCDSDIIVMPGTLPKLKYCLENDPGCAIVTTMRHDDKADGWKETALVLPKGLVVEGDTEINYDKLVIYYHEVMRNPEIVYKQIFFDDWDCLLMNLDIMKSVGDMDPELVHTSFSEDLTLRLEAARKTWGVCKTAVVWHKQRGTSKVSGNVFTADTAHMYKKWGKEFIIENTPRFWACTYRRPGILENREYWLTENHRLLGGWKGDS